MARLSFVALLTGFLLALPAVMAEAKEGGCSWCTPIWEDTVPLEPGKTFKKSFNVEEGEHYFTYMHINAQATMTVSGDVNTPDCEGVGEGEQVCTFKGIKKGQATLIVTAGAQPVQADLGFGPGMPPPD